MCAFEWNINQILHYSNHRRLGFVPALQNFKISNDYTYEPRCDTSNPSQISNYHESDAPVVYYSATAGNAVKLILMSEAFDEKLNEGFYFCKVHSSETQSNWIEILWNKRCSMQIISP